MISSFSVLKMLSLTAFRGVFGITACADLCSARAAEVTFATFYTHEYLYQTKRKEEHNGYPLTPINSQKTLEDNPNQSTCF